MTALYDSAEAPKKIILVSVETPETEDAQESLEELKELCENLNSQVVLSVLQRRTSPHPATFVGEGKLEELKTAVENLEADFVIFDTELAPTQIRNLEKALKTEIKPEGICSGSAAKKTPSPPWPSAATPTRGSPPCSTG